MARNGVTSRINENSIGNRPFRHPTSSSLNANRRTSTSSVNGPFGVNPDTSGSNDDYFDSFTTDNSPDFLDSDSSFGSNNFESHTSSSFGFNNQPSSRPNPAFASGSRGSEVNVHRPGFATGSRSGGSTGFGGSPGFGSSSRFSVNSGNRRVGGGGGGGGGSLSRPTGSSSSRPIFTPVSGPVDQYCLDCLCYAASKCDLKHHCSGSVCGPYLISWGFWADGGKLGNDYVTCSRDKACSESTVQGYMNRWKTDCNGDGLIDCQDFAIIHQLGPTSCSSRSIIATSFWKEFDSCLNPALDSRSKLD